MLIVDCHGTSDIFCNVSTSGGQIFREILRETITIRHLKRKRHNNKLQHFLPYFIFSKERLAVNIGLQQQI